MKVYIGADHRGFELKGKLVTYLTDQNYEVEDCGAHAYDANDDYPLIVDRVIEKMDVGEDRGIVICGSGIGVDIAANRHTGIRCGLAMNVEQVTHGRDHENINMLALAADELTYDQATELVDAFLKTEALEEERMIRREKQLDEL